MASLFKITDILLVVIFSLVGFIAGKAIIRSEERPHRLEQSGVNSPSSFRRAPSFVRSASFSSPQGLELAPYFSSGKSSRELAQITNKLINAKSPQDWGSELERILSYPLGGQERSLALLILFCRWAETDFPGALNGASKVCFDSSLFVSEIFSQLAAKDHKKALEYYDSNKESLGVVSFSIPGDIARNWAMHDPDEALDWCFSLRNNEMVELAALIDFMRGVGFDTGTANTYIDKIYAEKGFVPNQIITEWAAEDPLSALEWGRRLGEQNSYHQESILKGIAKNNISMAKNLWSEFSEEDRLRFSHIISENIEDPGEALSWVLEVEPVSGIESTSLFRMESWSRENPGDAENWIRNLPASPAKDIAIKLYVENVPDIQPYETILQLIEEVEQPAIKEEATKIIHEKRGSVIPNTNRI